MSYTVGMHKYIRNGYIETVTWIAHRPCLMMSDIISWITKVYLWKRRQYCLFLHVKNKEEERALW